MQARTVPPVTPPSPSPVPLAAPAPEAPRAGWFFNPYVQIFASIALSAVAQICLKKGADQGHIAEIWMGVEGLRSGWTWVAIAAMIGSLFFWLYGLRFVPLNVAFNLAGLIQVLVPVSSWLFLGEQIGFRRACGILLVLLGVLIVARPLMVVEEKL